MIAFRTYFAGMRLSMLRVVQLCFLSTLLWGCGTTQIKEGNTRTAAGGLANLSDVQLGDYDKALALLESKKPAEAEQVLQKLVKVKPEVPELWLNLALSQYQQDKIEPVQATLDSLLLKSQSIAQAYNLKGLVSVKKGLFKEATDNYQVAIGLTPNYGNALYNMALLYDVYLQDIPKAIDYYQQYLQVETSDQVTKDWVEHLKSSLLK